MIKIIPFLLLLAFGIQAKELTLTTYNIGLAHTFVPYAKERLPQIVGALAKHDTDILCLQEAWTKSDRKKIEKGLKNKFDQNLFMKIKNFREGSRPTCRIKELFGEGKFVSCMQTQCKGLDGDEFTDCILNRCGTALTELKQSNRQCATALMAQVGKNTILGMLTILNPFARAGLFAYKGSDGLMLFSKYPITKTSMVDFSNLSTLNRRRALKAEVDVDGKKLTVMCTHLTADLSRTVPYTGKFSSWESENKQQVELLMKSAESSQGSTIVMGDFNCGFSSAGVDGELTESCEQIKNHGFINALEETNPQCTFCQSNLLNYKETKSVAIDHILLRGLKLLETSIDFKEPIEIEDSVTTNLSDHFGITARIELD